MFLKNPKLLFKSSSFRLITWYTVIFIISSLIINIYTYSVISSFIYEQSRDEIYEDLDEMGVLYEEEGLETLKEDVFEDDYESIFHRLIGNEGQTIILRIPEDWDEFNVNKLDVANSLNNKEWISVEGDEQDYEFKSKVLFDGTVLQLGQSMDKRENLLAKIRKVFIFAIIPIVLFAYIGGVFIADRALSPIRQLINTLNSIVSSARIKERAPVAPAADKFSKELITLFNSMLDKIESLINGMKNILDNVAHDLRTPMTRLRGTAEMALQSENNEHELREAISDCIEESERILLTLNTLMDVSEAETGALKLNPERNNIAELIDGVVDLYGYVAEEKKVSLNKIYPAEFFLTIDSNWMRQVLANLLDNAIKYTPPGGKIDIEVVHKGTKAVIKIKDTGIGIPKEELENIWERLYRGDESRTQRGLGLGLSLVKAIVGAHRGYVEVTSEPGSGSIFSIYLPA